jgi:hypothetical protein
VLSHPNRFDLRFNVTRNVELALLWSRVEALLVNGGRNRVDEIAGTKPNMDLDPNNLKVATMLKNCKIWWAKRPNRLPSETVCPVEALKIFQHEDEEITLKALFLEFESASLHRPLAKTILLRHFLPRDSHGNWPEVDSPASLILAIRGLGYWLFFLLRWEKVFSNLLDELLEQRAFTRFSVRYFCQELYNALASIPDRAETITDLSAHTDIAHMNAFVARLADIRTIMTNDGSDILYENLRTAPGGPGVDSLIGKLFVAEQAAATAQAAPPPAAQVTSPPATSKDRPHGRSRSRSRDQQRDRRDRSPQRGNQQGNRGGRDKDRERGGDKRGKGTRYCLNNFQYMLGTSEKPCGYRSDCHHKHLSEVRAHEFKEVEAQIFDGLNRKDGDELLARLKTSARSPFSSAGGGGGYHGGTSSGGGQSGGGGKGGGGSGGGGSGPK